MVIAAVLSTVAVPVIVIVAVVVVVNAAVAVNPAGRFVTQAVFVETSTGLVNVSPDNVIKNDLVPAVAPTVPVATVA
jgi:hypothetical protein